MLIILKLSPTFKVTAIFANTVSQRRPGAVMRLGGVVGPFSLIHACVNSGKPNEE
ncbi:hypothetical protein J6590_068523 [Homalodisca vitripennis]|nr:hypothetical protein J6590_068523 [Homalodisca vitripennis]